MKNNFLFSLFTIIALISPTMGISQAVQSYEAVLPLYNNNRLMGDVKVTIENEKLISVDKASLLDAIRKELNPDTIRSFESLNAKINPETMPIPVIFNPQDLKLDMPFDIELRSREKVDLLEDYHRRYENEALRPASFGGAINSRLEQSWSSNPAEQDFLSGQFDSFLNMNTLVFENQSYYQSNIDQKFFRGDARLVKDIERHQVRFQAGDVHPQIQGFMVGRPIGGINVSRNFSLNPYRLPYPSGAQEFSLQARSLVKYFVNGTMIKSEYLPPGNYTARDIPLNNGLNTIIIEATDELGIKKVFIFKSAASINLLNEGESKFDISYGTPIFDQNFKREYRHEDGNLLSSFFQYGFNSTLSSSVYGQNQKDFTLVGTEVIKATVIGNLGAGVAHSANDALSGEAEALSYQFLGTGKDWFANHSLGLRYEHRDKEFRSSLLDTMSVVQNNYAANYALPLAKFLTVAVGGNYGDVRDNKLSDRYGFDSTLNMRLFDKHNLSFFVGRNRNENKVWNDIAYVFLTITFPDSNDFLSTFYDQQQKNTKVTYLHDNQNRLYSPKAQAIVENSALAQSGETDILYPTPIADIGGRVNATHLLSDDKVYGRGSIRLNSALVFAKDNDDWAFGISRPVPTSFVIFKPESKLDGQKIALKSTSPYNESETGLFGEITFANLLPYQYREVQVDPTYLDEGRSLKQEKFVLYPTYRSAHLVRLEDKGSLMLRGFLQTPTGAPWALQVGHVGDATFFTNRDGEFFIEGIEPGKYELSLEGQPNKAKLIIDDNERGIRNVGTIVIEEDL